MGCCGSTQAGDTDPPPSSAVAATQVGTSLTPIASTSSRTRAARPVQALSTTHSPSVSRTSTPLRRPSSNHSPRLNNLPSHERYNVPLTPPPAWTSTSRTWTPSQLHRERHDFFDTRVTGRSEIWGALQNVCELVRSGDIATAQGILDAAAITLPTGNLVDGCYDEIGNLYRLPEVVVSDPGNLGADTEGEDITVDGSRHSNNIDGETMIGFPESKVSATAEERVLDREDKDVEEEDREVLERRKEDKGKASERDAVKVRCRLSDRGGPDVVIALGKSQYVATLVRRVQAEGNVSPSLRIRLAYLGKMLNEKDTLEAQGWKEGHVINAMVVGVS